MPSEVRAIRLKDITTALSAEDCITAMAMAMEELAMAQALVIIHGSERAARMYVERGGHVRFDDDGEPVILWSDALVARLTGEATDG